MTNRCLSFIIIIGGVCLSYIYIYIELYKKIILFIFCLISSFFHIKQKKGFKSFLKKL
uniref:Uncharacterized protein n=1 Tax=Staphylococcus phage 184DA TaxID=3110532 RepID=A0AAU6MXS5_9CAUD